MSSSNRLLFTAAIYGLVVAVILALVVQVGLVGRGLRHDAQTQHQGYQSDQERERLLTWCASTDTPAESYAAQNCERARAYADLEAQRTMAYWANTQANISFWGLIGLGFTVTFAFLAWREAKRQADVAERELLVARKPRLEIVPQGGLFWEGDIPHLHVLLRNTGGSRAVLSTAGECEFRVTNRPQAVIEKHTIAAEAAQEFDIGETLLEPAEGVLLVLRAKKALSANDTALFHGRLALLLVLIEILYDDHLGTERIFEALIGCTREMAVPLQDDDYAVEDNEEASHARRRRWSDRYRPA
jgi:hypothetical protein